MNHFAGPKVGVRGLGSCGCMNRTIENLSDDCRKLISGENLCFRDNSSQSSRNVTCWQAGNSVPRTHHHHHHHSSPPLQQSLTNLCLTDLNLRPPPAEILRPAYLLSTLCWLLLSRRDISTLSRSLACVDIYIHIYISTYLHNTQYAGHLECVPPPPQHPMLHAFTNTPMYYLGPRGNCCNMK